LCVLKERKFAELGRKRDILNEVALLKTLSHTNVIKCYGNFWDYGSGALYMVLEYADDGDLFSAVAKRRREGGYWPEEKIWKMFYQLCLGVDHLHSNGVIHRDIKSLNIMKTKSGLLKIGDLGVSRQVGQDTMMLQTFYGTPLYASPELCENKPYNEKTDIWSLGVVLYEMACLQPPFSGQNLIALAEAIRQATYPKLPAIFSESLSRMIGMMLQKNYSKRPSIKQILSWFGKGYVEKMEELYAEEGGEGGRSNDGSGLGGSRGIDLDEERERRLRKKKEYNELSEKLQKERDKSRERGETRNLKREGERERFEERNGVITSELGRDSGRDLSGKWDDEDGNSNSNIYVGLHYHHRPTDDTEEEEPRIHKNNKLSEHDDNILFKPSRVPRPEKTNHEKRNGNARTENELRRLQLKLKNMTKVNLMSSGNKRNDGGAYPQMRPAVGAKEAVELVEREIARLKKKLGRGGGGGGGGGGKDFVAATAPPQPVKSAWRAEEEEEKEEERNKKVIEEHRQRQQQVERVPAAVKVKNNAPPANEREARLRQRVLEREMRLQRVRSAREERDQQHRARTVPNTTNVKSQDIYLSKVASATEERKQRDIEIERRERERELERESEQAKELESIPKATADEENTEEESSSSTEVEMSSSSSSSDDDDDDDDDDEPQRRQLQQQQQRPQTAVARRHKKNSSPPPQPRRQEPHRAVQQQPRVRARQSRPVSIHATGNARKIGIHHLFREDDENCSGGGGRGGGGGHQLRRVNGTNMRGNFDSFFDGRERNNERPTTAPVKGGAQRTQRFNFIKQMWE